MKLIVIDPRHVGLANKADVWLRVRPGTDGALALGLANLMIERGWYDRDFMRDWSNGPLLVRADTGRLLRESDLRAARRCAPSCRLGCAATSAGRLRSGDRPLRRAGRRCPRSRGRVSRRHDGGHDRLPAGLRPLRRAVRKLLARSGRGDVLDPADQLEEAARLIWHARPVSYYAWSGHEHHANTTETARAMALLYALTGSFDAPGGNVLLPAVADGADHRRGPARREAAWRRPIGVRRTSARPGALEQRIDPRFLSRDPRGRALSGARTDRLRREPAAGPGRSGARARRAGGARLLRPRRPVHEPDGRARRHRAAGRIAASSAKR